MNITDVIRAAQFTELSNRLCCICFIKLANVVADKEVWRGLELVGVILGISDDCSHVRLIYDFGYSCNILSDIPIRFVRRVEPLSLGDMHSKRLIDMFKSEAFEKAEVSLL